MQILLLPIFLLFLTACETYYVNVKKMHVDKSSLASTFARTPDPLTVHPPEGQKLVVEWRLPRRFTNQPMTLFLNVIYKNLDTKELIYPIQTNVGWVSYSLLDEEYKKRGGILSYRAILYDEEGKEIKNYTQAMWFDKVPLKSSPCFKDLLQQIQKGENSLSPLTPPKRPD